MSTNVIEFVAAQFLVQIELNCRAIVIANPHFVPLSPVESNPFTPGESSARNFTGALPKLDVTVPTRPSKRLAIYW
jgi:hypothetical protein